MCSSETQVSNQNIQSFSEMGILSFWWFTMLANCGNNMFCRQRREEEWVNSGGSSSRVLAASKVQPFSKSMKEGCCFAQGENIDHIFFNILDWALQYSADNLLRKSEKKSRNHMKMVSFWIHKFVAVPTFIPSPLLIYGWQSKKSNQRRCLFGFNFCCWSTSPTFHVDRISSCG